MIGSHHAQMPLGIGGAANATCASETKQNHSRSFRPPKSFSGSEHFEPAKGIENAVFGKPQLAGSWNCVRISWLVFRGYRHED